MLTKSPPMHRHDGTSPLPFGMDWSQPPRVWNGPDTDWPHAFYTGWSYCVTIPSWTVLPKSRNSDPVVFYRVQIGIQSSDGLTTTRLILRRFSDFLKLLTDLKQAFPKKKLSSAPPKGLLRLKSRALLEERRCSLELWMTNLLSDINVSRSFAVASFLELEAAARSYFQDGDQPNSDRSLTSGSSTNSLIQLPPSLSSSVFFNESAITSDCGSDGGYETSEIETTKLGQETDSEIGTEDLTGDVDLTNSVEKLVMFGIANIDEGLFKGQTILDQLEGIPRRKVPARQLTDSAGKQENGAAVEGAFGSSANLISCDGSDMPKSTISNLVDDGFCDYSGGAYRSKSPENFVNKELQFPGGTQPVFRLDESHKLNRLLMNMHQRLLTAKTDMEDLIARLNGEITVKDYLMTKVMDLEVELETTRHKGKENLQQAILIERERVTKMQWDMDELRRKSLEAELQLKEKLHTVPVQDITVLSHKLETTQDKLKHILKIHEEFEAKSKSDMKVLVKEVKSLRSSQADLSRQLCQALKEKSEAERLLEENRNVEHASFGKNKPLNECVGLWNQLQECNIDILTGDEDEMVSHHLLTASDNKLKKVGDNEKKDNVEIREEEDMKMQMMLKLALIEIARLRKRLDWVNTSPNTEPSHL